MTEAGAAFRRERQMFGGISSCFIDSCVLVVAVRLVGEKMPRPKRLPRGIPSSSPIGAEGPGLRELTSTYASTLSRPLIGCRLAIERHRGVALYVVPNRFREQAVGLTVWKADETESRSPGEFSQSCREVRDPLMRRHDPKDANVSIEDLRPIGDERSLLREGGIAGNFFEALSKALR